MDRHSTQIDSEYYNLRFTEYSVNILVSIKFCVKEQFYNCYIPDDILCAYIIIIIYI